MRVRRVWFVLLVGLVLVASGLVGAYGSSGAAQPGTIDLNDYLNFAHNRTWRFYNQELALAQNGAPTGNWIDIKTVPGASTPDETHLRVRENVSVCTTADTWRWDFWKNSPKAY